MSTNEQKEDIIDSENNNENGGEKIEDTDKGQDQDDSKEGAEDKDDEQGKPTESLEDRRARLLRQLKQVDKKLGTKTEDKPSRTTSKRSDGFDYGEKAYLTANGIKGSDEHEFTLKLQKQTGLDLDSLMEDTYFQTKLSEFRETRATSNAMPNGTKRSNNSSVDTVEYWIAKNELPPVSEVELRRKVVNARLKKDQSKGVFYNS